MTKTNGKIFQTIQKTRFWSHFEPFLPDWAKMNFPGKKGSVSF